MFTAVVIVVVLVCLEVGLHGWALWMPKGELKGFKRVLEIDLQTRWHVEMERLRTAATEIVLVKSLDDTWYRSRAGKWYKRAARLEQRLAKRTERFGKLYQRCVLPFGVYAAIAKTEPPRLLSRPNYPCILNCDPPADTPAYRVETAQRALAVGLMQRGVIWSGPEGQSEENGVV